MMNKISGIFLFMKYSEIKIDEIVEFPEMKIPSIKVESGNTQINYTIDSDFPEDNFIKIHSNSGKIKLYFKTEVCVELIDLVRVECDDWFQDENIPKQSVDGPEFRWNEFENIVEYNVLRTIGDGLAVNYINHIDLEFAKISSISKTLLKEHPTFELVLKASYTELSEKNEVFDFHTGPFKFFCKKIIIMNDE